MSHTDSDVPETYLRFLADGLGKCGIPVQLRRDADGRQYVRASHPKVPLSTDILCVQDNDGIWTFASERGSTITPAADTVRAIEYIVSLFHYALASWVCRTWMAETKLGLGWARGSGPWPGVGSGPVEVGRSGGGFDGDVVAEG